jgi:hypothetical protein
MNSHKNARLTYVRRIEMVRVITQRGLSVPRAACAHARMRAWRERANRVQFLRDAVTFVIPMMAAPRGLSRGV